MRLSKKLICGCAALLGLMFSAPSQAMGELENVTLTVYVNPVGAPHAYLENDITHPQGLDVDIIYELQRRLMFNLRDNRIYPLDRASAFARMQAGEADLVGGGISYTMARAKIFKFTPIFLSSGLTVVYSPRFHPEIKSSQDIKGLNVGVEKGATSEDYAAKLGAKTTYFSNNILALFKVANGQLDAIIYDRPPMDDFVLAVPSVGLKTLDETFGEEACQFAMAMPKDSEYADIIADTIEAMMMDGTMTALLKKWGVQGFVEEMGDR